MIKVLGIILLPLIFVSLSSVAWAGNIGEPPAKRGARWGAKGGAALGLVMGAATGNAKIAVAGAAVGAAAGAGGAAMYEYDQSKQDNRTQMIADSISTSKSQGAVVADQSAVAGETVGDAGKRHFQEFLGQWTLEIWALDENGKRITASGKAQGLKVDDNTVRIVYREIKVPGSGEKIGGGYSLISYQPGQGFFLENEFAIVDGIMMFVGEYLTDKNAYNYYLNNNTDGKMLSGGIVRSSVRVEIRSSGPSLFTAETYTLIDGKEVQVQSYRFIKAAG